MPTTLGIFQGLLGLLHFDKNAYAEWEHGWDRPLPYRERNAFFKVFTGLDHEGLHHAGGELPDARVFDYHGKFIGMVADPGEFTAPGTSGTFWSISHGTPVYTLFTANNDAQCIAFATITWPGMSNHGAWVGDWGSECVGDDRSIATWYFSNVVVPGTNHFPNCMWLDMDGGQPATAFQVNWVDMTPGENDTRIGKSPKDMCQSPSFFIYQHYDPGTIVRHDREHDRQKPGPGAVLKRSEQAPPIKRNKPRRTAAQARLAFEQKYGNMLVIDDLPSHTAHALCESASSDGPSFVNPEHGYFCDMQTKTIHPVCKTQNGTAVCFEMDQKQLVGPGLHKRSVPFEVKDWRLSRMNGTAQDI